MNFTDKQIKLAGVIQPEGGAREFEQGLDLQGEGIRVLQNDRTIFEENVGDCCEDLQTCEIAIGACEEENVTLQEEKTALCEELNKAQPEGTFSYSKLNSTRPFGSEWRDYYQSFGTLILLPDNGGEIRFAKSGGNQFLYALNENTQQIVYTPHHTLGSNTWKVLNANNQELTAIDTVNPPFIVRPFSAAVDFDGNLGTTYPAPTYFTAGTFTVQSVDGGDAVVGFVDYGCDEE